MKVLIHGRCGKPAARQKQADRVFRSGGEVTSADWEHVDGRPWVAGEPMTCDSCGLTMDTSDWKTVRIADA